MKIGEPEEAATRRAAKPVVCCAATEEVLADVAALEVLGPAAEWPEPATSRYGRSRGT